MMPGTDLPILSAIFLLPTLATLPTYYIGKVNEGYSKWLGTLISGIVLALSVVAWYFYETPAAGGFSLVESYDWIPYIGVKYILGVDGLGFPLILLTTLVTFASFVASFPEIHHREPDFYALVLLLETGMLGTFMALDLFLFYICWELVLVPMFFLIGIWGAGRREYSAIKFFIYTHVASLVMLLGIISLWLESAEQLGKGTFSIIDLSTKVTFSEALFPLLPIVFLAFTFGFIVKVPSVPFHTWLPDAHVDAPTPGSMILAGLLLKMGGYGLLRFGGWILPEGVKQFAWLLAAIGMISLIYGSMVALRQSDMKRLIAYSSIGHMGIVLLGLASQTPEGFVGAVYMMVAHGIISPLLFFLSGVIHHHAGTRQIEKLKGLSKNMPGTAAVLVFASFASAGLPGLAGFVAELTALVGLFIWNPAVAAIAVLGIIITAAYYLWMLQRTVFGPKNPDLEGTTDALRVELIPFAILVIFTVILGLFPWPFIDIMESAALFFESQL